MIQLNLIRRSFGVVSIMFAAVLMMSSCTSMKMKKELTFHSVQLEQLANSSRKPIDKIDALAAISIEALENSLDYNKSKDVVKFIKLYSKQNKSSINKIYDEISNWYLNLSDSEKLVVAARLATKPYIRQLLHLVPKVEKKINRKLNKIFYMSRFLDLLKLGI